MFFPHFERFLGQKKSPHQKLLAVVLDLKITLLPVTMVAGPSQRKPGSASSSMLVRYLLTFGQPLIWREMRNQFASACDAKFVQLRRSRPRK